MKLSSGRWSEPRQLLIQQTMMGSERAAENKPAQTVINNTKWLQISGCGILRNCVTVIENWQ